MNTRFYNAWILTMEEEYPLTFQGELWVEENRITYVGEGKPSTIRWDREIDCDCNLLMPGFKNAHSHSAMTFLRSYADDLPLQEWLYNRVFPMEAKLTKPDMITLSKIGIMEYLTSGITANFDMYIENECHAKASIETGFRTVLCGSMNDYVGSIEKTEEEYLKWNHENPLIRMQIGFHAEYTTSRDKIEALAKLADKYEAPVYMHLAETEKEVRECVERYQMSPVQFLDSLGIFEHGGGGFHGVWMNPEDMDICQRRGVSIVSNPGSNVKLASGIVDLVGLLEKKINVALGTDGPASNNALDMFREMYLASVLQKVAKKDAAAMDANAVLRMATVGGAKAMGLTDCDVLAEGKLADIILIDLQQPNMQPIHNITKNLVYSGSKENVKLTMIDGVIRYEDGKFNIGEEPKDIYRTANEIVGRMRE